MGELATPFIPAGLKKLNRRLTAGVFVSSFPIRSCRSSAINTKLQKRAPPFPGWNPLEHLLVYITSALWINYAVPWRSSQKAARKHRTGRPRSPAYVSEVVQLGIYSTGARDPNYLIGRTYFWSQLDRTDDKCFNLALIDIRPASRHRCQVF